MTALTITCLGSFQVALDGRSLSAAASEKALALLAYLAIESRRMHRREHLAGLLWSDQPEKNALHSLRQALSSLRKALHDDQREQPILLVAPDGVQINPKANYWLDVNAFQTELTAALAHHQHCKTGGCLNVRRLRAAVDLFKGPFLDQLIINGGPLFDEWAMLQREYFNRMAVEAFSRLAEVHERRGEFARAAQIAARIVQIMPWEEDAHYQLMRLLGLDGQWAAVQAQYAACRRYLEEQMGLEPAPETRALYQAALQAARSGTPVKPVSAFQPRFPAAFHNLPRTGQPFVGRQNELDLLADRLADPQWRLLTLTGPGGVGKTRLALEAAAQMVGLLPGGVFFVPLASLSSAEMLPLVIADALRLKLYNAQDPQAQLINYLREKQALLVLDSFEYLLLAGPEAVDLVVEILEQSSGVSILVTSRQPLHLHQEWVYEVGILPCPAPVSPALAASAAPPGWEEIGAVQFFLHAARRVQPQFSGQEEWAAVTRICRVVDGLPLGMELAAAWVRAHSCAEIAAQLERSLAFLTTSMRDMPERHRSLQAVFEYSWNLLDADEQRQLAALSVFRGGFTLAAAGEVAGAQSEHLAALAEKSLLHRVGGQRYDMHVMLQQFAAQKLPGDAVQERQAHSDYFLQFLAQNKTTLHSAEQPSLLDALHNEVENLHAAWQWAVEQRQALALGAAADTLGSYYEMRSAFEQGWQDFSSAAAALADLQDDAPAGRVRGLCLAYQGMFEKQLGQYQTARESVAQSLAILEPLGAAEELAFACLALGKICVEQGELPQGRGHFEQGLHLLSESPNAWLKASLSDALGSVLSDLGEFGLTHQYYEKALLLFQQMGAPWGIARSSNSLGTLAGMRGDYAAAETYFRRALETFQSIGDHSGVARSLQNLSILAFLGEDYARARDLRLECLGICREIGFRWGIASVLKHLADAERALGETENARQHYQEGLGMSQALNDRKSAAYTYNSLGGLHFEENELDEAHRSYLEALRLVVEIAQAPLTADIICGLAEVAIARGNVKPALEWLACVQAQEGVDQQTRSRAGKLIDALAAGLPPEAVAQALARGQSLRLEEVVAAFLEDSGNG